LDRQPLGGEVEVGPLQSDDLTATHPGVRGEVQCRGQAPTPGVVEEGGQLSRCPRPSRRRRRRTRCPLGRP
jgi:hypothetical protein